MIYGYICDKKAIRLCVEPVKRMQQIDGEMIKVDPAAKWPYASRLTTRLPYFFSQRYLSKTFLAELASTLYGRATFHIWDITDIDDFLHHDFFGVGCLPKDHARKLSLVIFTDLYGDKCCSKRAMREKLAHLKQLSLLKHQQGFHLDLHLCLSNHPQRPIAARFQQILLPYLYELKAAGFAMRFPLRKYRYGKKPGSDYSEMNQFQTSNSKLPGDWVVDDEELEAWKESRYIQDAFKRSMLSLLGCYDSDNGPDDSDSASLPSDFEDGSIASDDEESVMLSRSMGYYNFVCSYVG